MKKTQQNINHTNVFLGQSARAIEIKAKINKWDQIKLINFSQQRKSQTDEKTTYGLGENISK